MAYFSNENDAVIELVPKDRETGVNVNSNNADGDDQGVCENSMITTIEQMSVLKPENCDYANVEESSQGVCLIAAPTIHTLKNTEDTLAAEGTLNLKNNIDQKEETSNSFSQVQEESECSLTAKLSENDNDCNKNEYDMQEEEEMLRTLKSSKKARRQQNKKKNSRVQSKTKVPTTELTKESVALLQRQLADQNEVNTNVQIDLNGSATETVQRKARRVAETRMSKKEALRLLHASHKQMRKDAKNINLKELFERTIMSKAGNCNGVTNNNSNNRIDKKNNSVLQHDAIAVGTENTIQDPEKEERKELLPTTAPTMTTIKSQETNGTCSNKTNLFTSPTLGSPLSLTAWSSEMISELTQSVLEDVKEQRRIRMARTLPRQRNRLSPFSAPYSRSNFINNNSYRETAGASLASAPYSPLTNSSSQSNWESQHKTNNHRQNEYYEQVKLSNEYDEEEILVIGDKDEIYEDIVRLHTNDEEENAAEINGTEHENEECTLTKEQQQQQQTYGHTSTKKCNNDSNNNNNDNNDDEEDEEALLFVPSFVPVVNERSAAMLSAEKQKMWFSANCDELGIYTSSNTQPKLMEPTKSLLSNATSSSHSQPPLCTSESTEMMATAEDDSSHFSFADCQPTQAECEAERATVHALKRKQEMWKLKQQLLRSQKELNKSILASDSKSLIVNTESNVRMPSSLYLSPSSSQSQSPLLSLNTSNLQQANFSFAHSDVNSHAKYNQAHTVDSGLPTSADQLSHFTPFSPLSNSMSTLSSSTTGEASTSMPMHETPKLKLSNETLSFIRRMNNFDNTSTQKIVIFEPASKTKTQSQI